MELTLSLPVNITEGQGSLTFPEALKRKPLNTFIRCQSICFSNSVSAVEFPLFVVCSGSCYLTRDRQINRNILGMFKPTPGGLVNFNSSKDIPITIPEELMHIEVIDFQGLRKNISGMIVVEIRGTIVNRFLAV